MVKFTISSPQSQDINCFGNVSVCGKCFGLVMLSAARVPGEAWDERKPKHPEDVLLAMQLQGVLFHTFFCLESCAIGK
jgi:hypothetical protein